MIKPLLWITGVIAAGYLFILLFMYLFQAQMVFHPTKQMGTDPSAAGLPFEDVTFETTNGLQLHGWFVTAGDSAPTILYCHGNAGNISGRLETIRLLHELGLNVFIFDYRGYGRSEGTPSETGTYRDASAAWGYLTETRGIEKEKIIAMGRSLGGSVAAWLAARKDPAAAIVESSFTSAAQLAADFYPWLPVRWLLKYDYNTIAYLQNIKAPVFMAHSRDDEIVPFHHGKTLFEAAGKPKMFVELRGSHASGFLETETKYRKQLRSFLVKHTPYKMY
ncbi:alpha/beta hydrolase [Fodinibius sp.]|uniref:alpha/beta hydrolase n=1 Tax=Fodinibius sp. TaxID=1872440 RepID=UPI0035687040